MGSQKCAKNGGDCNDVVELQSHAPKASKVSKIVWESLLGRFSSSILPTRIKKSRVWASEEVIWLEREGQFAPWIE